MLRRRAEETEPVTPSRCCSPSAPPCTHHRNVVRTVPSVPHHPRRSFLHPLQPISPPFEPSECRSARCLAASRAPHPAPPPPPHTCFRGGAGGGAFGRRWVGGWVGESTTTAALETGSTRLPQGSTAGKQTSRTQVRTWPGRAATRIHPQNKSNTHIPTHKNKQQCGRAHGQDRKHRAVHGH